MKKAKILNDGPKATEAAYLMGVVTSATDKLMLTDAVHIGAYAKPETAEALSEAGKEFMLVSATMHSLMEAKWEKKDEKGVEEIIQQNASLIAVLLGIAYYEGAKHAIETSMTMEQLRDMRYKEDKDRDKAQEEREA